MIRARRVALNNVQLDQANSAIVIRSIELQDSKDSISAASSAAGFGQRITGSRRDTVDVVVKFAIDIKKTSLANRATALEAVNAWAARASISRGGAWLTVNYRSGRRIRVVLAQAPGEGNLWDWTKEFTITFRAYYIPYWEDAAESTGTIGSGTSGSANITVAGSAPAQVNVTVNNTSGGTVDAVSVAVGEKTMAFTSLALANGEKLIIDHTINGFVRIRIQASGGTYRSAMAARTTASADDLTAMPGTVACSFTAGASCSVSASWRNRYL